MPPVTNRGYVFIYLGVLACRRGERAHGAELIRTGLATARDLGEPQFTADALRATAGAIWEEDPLAPARLWGAAEALYAQIGASERIDRAIYAAAIERGGLMAGRDQFHAAWRDGAGAPLDEMVAQAEQLLLRAVPMSAGTS